MKIILVSGRGNSGKTTSIKRFLRNQGVSTQERGDEKHVISIQRNGWKLIVGVATGGDTEAIVKKNIEMFDAVPCDVIVCASKSRGKTTNYVNGQAARRGAKLVKITTTIIDPYNKIRANIDHSRIAAEIDAHII